jgi:hypothetical protein
MGMKPSNNYQSDRPESGGADKDGIRENNGLLDREKEKFASEEARKKAERLEQPKRDDDLIRE